MIDFENPSFLKLRPVNDSKLERLIQPLLTPGEQVVQAFQSVRDGVVFTDRRVIAINVQGVTGMKKSFTSLPYRRVQAYAIESAGMGDLDGELQLWYSGLGAVKFELLAGSDLALLCRVIENAISG
ncbi:MULTISPECIES: PH domain-containing protein [unclassified Faecalibacterium]|mgnify:CR=1 FL=1|uniref:PH domain-containing protein n=1 Tax=unclassified Faecalibacterium TaxID=2646395 RepID=UPI000B3980E0|nr:MULTISPECIES: PH domain-containing protein [unclassified Faecalibacterium]OUN38669.1 cytoplasmic protein [Faecalibacterium sp. An77]OUP29368.1 cytoplasmic protein [Faecalibacterium sp. An192]OUQ35488.1 cytoplasmic protein [Faecalibacterium sp. An122]